MARNFDEKRDFFRMAANCVVTYNKAGEKKQHHGKCINLSAGGVLFTSKEDLSCGEKITLNITPDKAIVPPLNAVVEVIRCTPQASGENEIAGTIIELL